MALHNRSLEPIACGSGSASTLALMRFIPESIPQSAILPWLLARLFGLVGCLFMYGGELLHYGCGIALFGAAALANWIAKSAK